MARPDTSKDAKLKLKLNLATTTILIVEANESEQDILVQLLMGCGASSIQRCSTAEEAMAVMDRGSVDFAFVGSALPGMSGYDLVRTLRRHSQPAVRYLPIILTCGHVRRADVFKARDCGANFVVVKPLSAQVLFDRIVWMAKDLRRFIETDTYVGPDRRFKNFGPPLGMKGRRHDDLSAKLGEAKGENLTQDAIDSFFSTKK
jgi:CheY-like chemotaxis protein